jgi:hypothetical protein
MAAKQAKPYRHQRDLFDGDRPLRMKCPVCTGAKSVSFWSRQGKASVIGGKQVPCKTCGGTGRVPVREASMGSPIV